MDFSAFSNPSFDSVKWIDSMIAERPEEEQLDAFITSLTMKLHVVSQDYTDQLESGMVDAASMVPRCLTEISRTQGILKTLDTEMASLAIQLQEFDQRNINGVEDLSRLDMLKLNMEKCKATLKEHARWSQLVREAQGFLDGGGRFADSADRVEILSNSLEILHSMPGHDERLNTFNSLTSRLLASLQPVVLHEIMGTNMNSLRDSLYVYNKIKRSHDFIDIYTTHRPQKLETICNECFKASHPTATQIPAFYDHVYGFLADEHKHISFLFGEDQVSNLLCILIEKIMVPLQTAMSQRYKASDYSTVEEFSKRIAPLLANASDANLFKGLSSVYACFLQNMNMLLNTEGKWIRLQLHETVGSLKLGKIGDLSVGNNLSDTGLDVDEDDEVIDANDVSMLFETFGNKLATAIEDSSGHIQTSLMQSLLFLGGLRARRFLRFLVPLVSQHLKSLTGKVEELQSAACMTGSIDSSVRGVSGIAATEGGSDSDVATSTICNDLKRFGIADLGISKGRVLLPSALQVFRAASIMNNQFLILERVASELLEKVYTLLFNEHSLKDVVTMIALSSTLDSKGSGKLLSTIGVAKVKDAGVGAGAGAGMSVGSALAAMTLRQDPEVESELRAFLLASTRLTVSSVTQSVFSSSLGSLIKFKYTAEQYLFDLTTFASEVYLKDLHLDQAWQGSQEKEEEAGGDGGGGGDDDDDDDVEVDPESLLPQQAFTQVGEHLLSLLQELETFASCNTVENLIRLQDDAPPLISKGWRPLRAILELSDDEGYRNLAKRSSCQAAIATAETAMYGSSPSTSEGTGSNVNAAGDSQAEAEAEADVDEDDEEDDVLRFVNEWLGAISDYTVGVLLVQLCQISRLTSLGRAQLRVDLTYLNNVINALGLSRHPFLSHLVLLLEQDMTSVSTHLDFIPVSTSSALLLIHKFDSKIVSAVKSKEVLSTTPSLSIK